MRDRGSPWDGQHDGRSPEQPGERYLCGACMMCLRDSVQHLAGNSASSQWKPGNEGNSIALTIIDHVVPFAVRKAIAVLHRDNWDDLACSLDVLLRDVGQRDQANLAFVSQLSQRFDRGLKRDDGIRDMQLINVDAVQAQSFEASLNRLAKVRGSGIVGPLVRAGTIPTSLSGNHETSRVGEQRLGDQLLTYVWAVGIRRVNEIDIKLHGTAKNRYRPLAILWRTRDAFAGQAHGAEAETMHVNFPAQRNISSQACRKFFLVHN